MDFQCINPFNVRLNMISGNLLPMTANGSSFSILWKMYSILVWLLEIIHIITLILGCLLVPKEKAVKDGMIGLVVTLEVFFIVTRIHSCKRLVRQLIQKLNDILRQEDEMMRNIVTTTLKSMDTPLKFCWTTGVVSIILWCSLSLVSVFQKNQFFYMDYKMPVVYAKEPVSVGVYLIGSFVLTISSAYIFTKKVSVDTYMIHLILLVTAQYRYVALKLSIIFQNGILQNNHSASEEKHYRNTDWYAEKQIKILCRHHNALIHITFILKELLSLNFSLIYINNVFRFCSIGFMVLVISSESLVEASAIIVYACGGIVQLYLLCFCVQQLLDAGVELTDEAFHKKWYRYGASIKRTFLLMIMANNLECRLSRFEKFNLSLPSFMAILNQSYSIALLLRKTI